MEYKLRYAHFYWQGLDGAVFYIINELDSPTAAKRMVEKAEKTIQRIRENPLFYPLYHDENIAKKGYRYAVIGNYLLFYKIHENEKLIIIEAFVHGSRDVPNIIK